MSYSCGHGFAANAFQYASVAKGAGEVRTLMIPCAGNQRSSTAKMKIRIRPSQNVGSE